MHLPDMCYRVTVGSSATKIVRVNRRDPPKFGALGPRPFEMEMWLIPKNKPLPCMSYHVKIGNSALKAARINRKESPKLGSAGIRPFGWGVTDNLKKQAPSPCVLPCEM